MAKQTKRKAPVKRAARGTAVKPTGRWSRPGAAGWIVAGVLGVAWIAPSLPEFPEWQPPMSIDSARLSPSKEKALAELSTHEKPASGRGVGRNEPAPPAALQTEKSSRTVASLAKPVPRPTEPDQATASNSIRPKISASAAGRKPPSPVADDTPDKGTQRSAQLPIREHPYVTAPIIARIGDLRTVQILSGQGNWKRVKLASSGEIGWLQLTRVGTPAGPSIMATETRRAPLSPPIPSASLLSEAKAKQP